MGYSDPWRLGVCLAGLAHHQMRDIASSWHTGSRERNIFDSVDDSIGEGERGGIYWFSFPEAPFTSPHTYTPNFPSMLRRHERERVCV